VKKTTTFSMLLGISFKTSWWWLNPHIWIPNVLTLACSDSLLVFGADPLIMDLFPLLLSGGPRLENT
jgi:hypothetical protein